MAPTTESQLTKALQMVAVVCEWTYLHLELEYNVKLLDFTFSLAWLFAFGSLSKENRCLEQITATTMNSEQLEHI